MRNHGARQLLVRILTLVVLGSGIEPARAQFYDPDAPLSILPARQVDENLFLLRWLGDTYDNWPDGKTPADQVKPWLLDKRQQAARFQTLIRSRRLDSDLAEMYGHCIKFIGDYETFLANLVDIEQRARSQSGRDLIASVWTALQEGSNADSQARRNGSSASSAADTGKIVGTIAGLGELYQRSERADAARSAAIQAEQRRLTGAWTDTWAAAQVLSNRMAARYFWANGNMDLTATAAKACSTK
jgi:hypothetical protein